MQVDEQTKALFEDLKTGYPEREAIVRKALAAMPPDKAVETILTWQELAHRDRQFYWLTVGACLFFACLPTLLVPAEGSSFTITLMIWAFIMSAVVSSNNNRNLHKQCHKLLATFNDVRAIEPLVQQMIRGTEDVKLPAIVALTQLLPKLKPADAPLLSRSSRRALNDMLVSNVRVDFVLAILSAWEQVGDAEAVPFAERLILGNGAVGNNPTVRDAALFTRQAIQAAVDRASLSGTLLRPSESSDLSSTLLHPVTENAADPKTLLQAVSENPTSSSA